MNSSIKAFVKDTNKNVNTLIHTNKNVLTGIFHLC